MANRLRFDTGTRNRPEGGMPATEYIREGLSGRKQSVPGTPKAWQAGTPFLILARPWPLWSALQARKSLFWQLGVRNYHSCLLRAL